MSHDKHPLAAFLLGFIPGLGHLYLGRRGRALVYPFFFFGPLLLIALIVMTRSRFPDEILMFLLFCSFAVWGINMIDIVFTLINRSHPRQPYYPKTEDGSHVDATSAAVPSNVQRTGNELSNERFYTILLSFIPGLGHFQLGLMQRGLVFLTGFFGLTAMIFFIALLTDRGLFLVFLLILPVIWLYSMFDAIQALHRKQRGEPLEDRSVFEDFERFREEGKKSKVIATLLSILPGAGHMYLSLQRRGLQFMAAFLLSIYILDVMRLSIFLFLIPIFWFYSLFDALQHVSRYGQADSADVPFVDWFINHQKWLGIGLLLLGLYYLADQVVIPNLNTTEMGRIVVSWYHRYLQPFVVSVLFIGGGLRLLLGSKKRENKR